MSFARPKGRRIEFEPDVYDREKFRTSIKSGQMLPLRKLIQDEGASKEGMPPELSGLDLPGYLGHEHQLQAGSVVGWLLGEGNRGKFKGSLKRYMDALVKATEEEEQRFREEQEKKEKAAREKAAAEAARRADKADDVDEEDDEDEDEDAADGFEEAWKDMLKAYGEKAKAIRERAFKEAFGGLSDKDWSRADAQWQKYAS
jgi:hypothetical protein